MAVFTNCFLKCRGWQQSTQLLEYVSEFGVDQGFRFDKPTITVPRDQRTSFALRAICSIPITTTSMDQTHSTGHATQYIILPSTCLITNEAAVAAFKLLYFHTVLICLLRDGVRFRYYPSGLVEGFDRIENLEKYFLSRIPKSCLLVDS